MKTKKQILMLLLAMLAGIPTLSAQTVQGLTIVQPLLIAIRENIMDCLSFRCLSWMMKTMYCYRRWMKQ